MHAFDKNRADKGFSLIELIVVILVILLIAAFVLPNVFSKVKETKKTSEIYEARMTLIALQTALVADREDGQRDRILDRTDVYNVCPTKYGLEQMKKYAGIPIGSVSNIKVTPGDSVYGFVYYSTHESIVIYEKGEYTISVLH